MTGVRSTNISNRVPLSDDLIVNRDGSTGVQSVAALGTQLLGGAVGDQIEQVRTELSEAIGVVNDGYAANHELRSQLYANLVPAADQLGRVWGDPTSAYRGIYKKVGAPGAGNWTRIGPLPMIETLATRVAAGIMPAADKAYVDDNFRASLWTFYGEFGAASEFPTVVSEDNRVIEKISAATGTPIIDTGGGGPIVISGTSDEHMVGYVFGSVLRVIGGPAGDRLLNNDAGRTWMAAVARESTVQAMWQDAGSARHMCRVSPYSGDIYTDGEWTIWCGGGQSNGEGQAGSSAEAIRETYAYPNNLLMPATASGNVWLGMTTSGGVSIDFNPATITGLMGLKGMLASTGTHGTTAIESAALKYFDGAKGDCSYTPRMIVWNNSEGGQQIENMMPVPADPDRYYFANFQKIVARVKAVKPANIRAVYRWELFDQGEGNSGDAALGSKHNALRAAMETYVQAELEQTEPLRMMSLQPSSFFGDGGGARSILQFARDNEAAFGNFWCLGPTYHLPFSSDLLHKTSRGHDMQGEEYELAIRTVEKTGIWRPLCALSASVTATNTITVTLSQSAVIDNAGPVLAIANAGVVVPGKTVSAVDIVGTALTITTSDAAAGAAAVQFGMAGHTGERTAANVPRTNIRSTANYGNYRNGTAIRKWMCHQQISIT